MVLQTHRTHQPNLYLKDLGTEEKKTNKITPQSSETDSLSKLTSYMAVVNIAQYFRRTKTE